jgi:hypothetical protein
MFSSRRVALLALAGGPAVFPWAASADPCRDVKETP